LGPQHGPTGQTADFAYHDYALVPLEEEQRRLAVMHITFEHGGEGLTYLDEHENPLRYLLHWGVEAAMQQAQIEYGVTPDEWEAVHDRLPWKSTDTPKRWKVTDKRPRGR
jgi:hypothetical protein